MNARVTVQIAANSHVENIPVIRVCTLVDYGYDTSNVFVGYSPQVEKNFKKKKIFGPFYFKNEVFFIHYFISKLWDNHKKCFN